MGYTNVELQRMPYDELLKVKVEDMTELPPTRGLGFTRTIRYSCRHCHQQLEGSSRMLKKTANAKPVVCPYCGGKLWNPESSHSTRRTAFKPGHFDDERKKRYLRHLRERAKSI